MEAGIANLATTRCIRSIFGVVSRVEFLLSLPDLNGRFLCPHGGRLTMEVHSVSSCVAYAFMYDEGHSKIKGNLGKERK